MKIFHDKYDGYTELSFSERGGETVADACIARGQARISAKLHLNGEDTPCYFLITMGGGLTEGETYETKLNARAGTHAVVTTQAPAYVFKCINGETTRSNFDVKVGRDAALEYLPDDVIPYGRSRYVQTSDIHVAKGGSLMYTDGITAGWSPSGKDFQYYFAHMISRIYYAGQLVYNDNLILDPHAYDMAGLGLFDGSRNYSSFVVVDEKIDNAFVQELQEMGKGFEDAVIGVTRLEGPALVVRVLGDSLNGNKAILGRYIDFVRGKLYGLPHLDMRKDVSFKG